MLNIERRSAIMAYLKQHKAATVTELSHMMFIGEATIRRDLSALEREGGIKRTYGGAALTSGMDSEIPLYVREFEHKQEKDRIGAAAAKMAADGEVIILDSSTTTYQMVKYLSTKAGLSVVTNGAKTALALSGIPDMKVYSTGGYLREHSLSYTGAGAQSFIENIYADKLFFSCRALSAQKGLLDISEEEAQLRRQMIEHSKMSILLCDSSKFGAEAFHRICKIDKIDAIITDNIVPEAAQIQNEYGIQIICA